MKLNLLLLWPLLGHDTARHDQLSLFRVLRITACPVFSQSVSPKKAVTECTLGVYRETSEEIPIPSAKVCGSDGPMVSDSV